MSLLAQHSLVTFLLTTSLELIVRPKDRLAHQRVVRRKGESLAGVYRKLNPNKRFLFNGWDSTSSYRPATDSLVNHKIADENERKKRTSSAIL